MVHVARQHPFHPVKDWLTALTWTVCRGWTGCSSIGSAREDTALVRQIARRWLVGAVARVFAPGVQASHTMVVLVGAQGARKSTACAALVPDARWFTDTLFDVGSKDAMVQLQGVWAIQLAAAPVAAAERIWTP